MPPAPVFAFTKVKVVHGVLETGWVVVDVVVVEVVPDRELDGVYDEPPPVAGHLSVSPMT